MAAVTCSPLVKAARAEVQQCRGDLAGEVAGRDGGAGEGVAGALGRGGRDAGGDGAGDLGAIDGGADAAKDGDAQREAELVAGLADRRRRPGLAGRSRSDDQVDAEGDQGPGPTHSRRPARSRAPAKVVSCMLEILSGS